MIQGRRAMDRRLIAACSGVFVVALTVRLLVLATTSARLSPDTFEYTAIGKNIRTHGSFSVDTSPPRTPTIRRAPIYPLFLAAIGGPGGELSTDRVRLCQCFLDSLLSVVICLLVWNHVRHRWAVAAALLYSFHPGAVAYANSILAESLFAFLFTVSIGALVLAITRDKLGWAVAAGALIGLATLCRPVAAPFFVVAVGVMFLSRKAIARPLRLASLFCAASVLTMAPWVIRSSALAGQFVLASFKGPVNLYLATLPSSSWDLNDQASLFEAPQWLADPCSNALGSCHTAVECAQADDICERGAIANLRGNVGYYLRNRLRQVVHFPLTSFDFVTRNSSSLGTALRQREYRVLATKLFLYGLFAFTPLVFGSGGLMFGPATFGKRLCGAAWVYTILIYLPGFVEYRYFLPAVPVLLATSPYGFEWVDGRLRAAAMRLRRDQPARG